MHGVLLPSEQREDKISVTVLYYFWFSRISGGGCSAVELVLEFSVEQ